MVLRRALLIWGAGHLALGERRGWALVAAELLAIAALLGLAAIFLQSTRWLVVLAALVVFVVGWIGQAIDAHRRALGAGAAPGGEMQLAALLPVVVVLLGGFWLVGGDLGSPGATLQRYVAAWQSDRPDSAVALLDAPAEPAVLAANWRVQREQLRLLVTAGALRHGDQSGLDPQMPFNSLRFEEAVDRRGGRAVVTVNLVRRERFETELFGIIPTAAQRTVIVRRLGDVRLHAVPARAPAWLPLEKSPARVWLIDAINLDLGPG